jgi:hypothetical protein
MNAGKETMAWLVPYRQVALCGVYGMIGVYVLTSGDPRLDLLKPFALIAALLSWCTFDAAIHEKELPHGLVLVSLATFPVTLAVYLIWTRGRRRLLSYAKATALALAVIIASLATRSIR